MNKTNFFSILTAHLILAFLLFAFEGYLQIQHFAWERWVHPPGQYVFHRDSFDIGFSGKAQIQINSMGFRGPEIRPWHNEKILVMGSSAALGWMLDDSEFWTNLVAQKLEGTGKYPWIASTGRPGNRLIETYKQLEYFLSKGLRPDKVLVFGTGVEIITSLYQGTHYSPSRLGNLQDELEALERSFALKNGPFSPREPATLLWVKRLGQSHSSLLLPPENYFTHSRRKRAEANIVDTPPPKQDALLRNIQSNMSKIVELCRANSIELHFVTRPTLWGKAMNVSDEQRLWLGWGGNNQNKFPKPDEIHPFYYSAHAMNRSMEAYNQNILDTCTGLHLRCLDLSSQIPKSGDFLFDDNHLTPRGSQLAAEVVFKFLSQ